MEQVIKISNGLLEQIKNIQEYAIKNNMLNEQWFLNFQDELNKLSLDPEQ